ncbi:MULTISPECIES: YveK family protein [Priestia]|uniref:Capsular biosynthesis protein n=1 Tax=Priestia megaterium TaxID=1404 RepID=A0A3D8X325_PRIMG|nr:Wzz/FepE/Etk N-terminal domain-containing protein [Priestia megaterium]MDH3174003.1 Wzz/FepE/Etk N-terminal domain-containing protein [Priestia megaterium]RDZ14683.1 capsular biosynthesis protein [Priestia megaterium]USL37379.1 capsular biosynthesis protein [Priestia megaterium]
MEESIDLKQLFGVIKKRFWLIALLTIIAATISGVVSFFVLTPVYEANTQILVNQAKSKEQFYNSSELQTNVQLIQTYNDIIKSPAILGEVTKQLNLDMTPKQLSNQIQVTNSQDSQVAHIVVQDTNARLAVKIANTTAAVFKKEVPKIMSIDNVSILAKAQLDEALSPIKPQPFLNIAIAVVVGLMAGVGLAFLLEYLDNTIKNEQDVERILQLPVIGVISVIKEEELKNFSSASYASPVRGESRGA